MVEYSFGVLMFVVGVLMFGLGAIVGALLTTNTLRKAFVFSVRNDTEYLVDVQMDYYGKQVIIADVSKPKATKARARQAK